MAYPHGQYEALPMAADGTAVARVDLNSAADQLYWRPGLIPHFVKGVALHVVNAIGADGEVRADKRAAIGSDTGRGDGDCGILAIPNTTAAGKIIYDFVAPVKVSPGQEVVIQCTNVCAAGDLGDVYLLVEPCYEDPLNNANMIAGA